MEAVKQGAATVAVKSKTHVVLCALKVGLKSINK
jgi:20S proteasome alpha/beta subunit